MLSTSADIKPRDDKDAKSLSLVINAKHKNNDASIQNIAIIFDCQTFFSGSPKLSTIINNKVAGKSMAMEFMKGNDVPGISHSKDTKINSNAKSARLKFFRIIMIASLKFIYTLFSIMLILSDVSIGSG